MARSNKESLAQITIKLFACVKKDVKSAIEQGRLLQRAAEQHSGEYGFWLQRIGWAETSAKRYRDIYAFSQANPQIGGLNIAISALHILVDDSIPEKARKAIIKAAMKRRVSHSDAQSIVDEICAAEVEPPPPPIPPLLVMVTSMVATMATMTAKSR
jgi:hypothetical protein